MTRTLVVLVLGITLPSGWCAMAADEPPTELTPEARKELEAQGKEFANVLVQAYRAGKLPEAAEAGKKALETVRRLYAKQDHPELAKSLNNLAVVLTAQRKDTDAETLHREALAMHRRLYPKQDHPDLARSLHNLGLALDHQGKYADAEALYVEPVAMRRRLYPKQDHPDLAQSVHNLAFVLNRQWKYADAEALDREALAMRRRLYAKQDHPDLAHSLHNLGHALDHQAKYADAETYYVEAVAMRRRLYPRQDHRDLAGSLHLLANVLWAQGKYADAEAFVREAVAMYRALYPQQDHPLLADGLNSLAGVLLYQGKYADAETLYREALAIRRRLYPRLDHHDVADSLNNLAVVVNCQRRYADAETLYRQALRMYGTLARDYATVHSEGNALTNASSNASVLDGFLSNAWLSKTVAATVYQEVWASKATLSRVYEQHALASRAAAADPRAAALLDQLTDRRRRRADLLAAPTTTELATGKERDTALARYASEIESLDRELRPLLPTLDRADKLASAGPADLQKVLPADAAVVDFLRWTFFDHDARVPGKNGAKPAVRYLAFVLTRDTVSWINLEEAEPIEHAVSAWRDAISGGKDVPLELPARVRKLVWAKVRQDLPEQIKRLYLCPDVALCSLPWAALPGDKPTTILLEEYAITTIPHGAFLLDKLWPQDGMPKRPTDVLAVGGVAYGAALRAPDKAVVNRGEPLLKPGQTLAWPALAGAAAEIHGVTGAANKKQLICRTLGKEEASTAAVLAALPKARFAHLATHAFFADATFRSAFQVDSKRLEMTLRGERIGAGASPMMMTGLVFAGANEPSTASRGIITGEALVDLDLLGLDLAVLSACETRLGDVASGEGTFGLQRAFHLAGTRDVVASLWKVPDRPTAALMALFYRNLWEKEMPPVEALRQAQLEIYRHPDRIAALADDFRGNLRVVPGTAEPLVPPGPDGKAHPRLWAAFTLSGPGR